MQRFSVLHVPGSLFPLLAVDGDVSSWSLCAANDSRGQVNVIFRVSEVLMSGYDANHCYGVLLNIVRRGWYIFVRCS